MPYYDKNSRNNKYNYNISKHNNMAYLEREQSFLNIRMKVQN